MASVIPHPAPRPAGRRARPVEGPPRHAVLRFWIVATALEVVLAVVLLLSGADAAVEAGIAATGLAFNTDLVTAVLLVVLYPAAALGVVLALLQVAAPDAAVLVVARRVRRGPGSLADVASRFRFWSRDVGARRGAAVWLQMIAAFVALSLATAGLNLLVLGPQEHRFVPPASALALVGGLLVALFLDAGALFEENGWRGYALPLLLRRHGPVVASLVLGVAWAAWHYPVKYNAFLDYGPVGGAAYLGAFTLKIVLLTLVMTYFWQRAGQSTILAIAMHGLSNDSLRLQGELLGDSLRVAVLSELTISAPLAVLALALVLGTRGRLGAPGGRHSSA